MNDKLYQEKLKQVRKYFKKSELFLEFQLENYVGYFLYFRIDFYKKTKTYKLSWVDLEELDINNISGQISSEYIVDKKIEHIKNVISKIKEKEMNYYNLPEVNSKVRIFINTPTSIDNTFESTFYKFIPKSIAQISDVIIILFNNLPRMLENFLYVLHGELTNNKTKYEYKNKFSFDLFNDDIDSIFAYQIIDRGKKYYEENKVTFLEKIDTRYFAVVDGTQKYVVIIDFDESKKETQVYCSCPCEFYCKHIYAVILSIRNKQFDKRFYKISYRKPNVDLLERIMNFDYKLCIDIVEQNFEIINDYGEVELIPILDDRGRNNWEVIEDSEDEYLAKQIQKVVRGDF